MVSDVLVSPGENEEDATEIIEESQSRVESRNDGDPSSELDVSKSGKVAIKVKNNKKTR